MLLTAASNQRHIIRTNMWFHIAQRLHLVNVERRDLAVWKWVGAENRVLRILPFHQRFSCGTIFPAMCRKGDGLRKDFGNNRGCDHFVRVLQLIELDSIKFKVSKILGAFIATTPFPASSTPPCHISLYSILAHPVVSVFCQLSPKQQKYQISPTKRPCGSGCANHWN